MSDSADIINSNNAFFEENARIQKTIQQLTSGFAHEIRNPLNAILAIVEALYQDLNQYADYIEYFDQLNIQTMKISSLIQDLVEIGNPYQPTSLNLDSLSRLCESAMKSWMRSTRYQKHAVKLIPSFELSNATLNIDVAKIQKVFFAILENAAQHSPEDSEILIQISEPNEKSLRINVIDHGNGIPAEIMPLVFDFFFTTRSHGRGLGLCFVRQAMESHSGSVVIRNNDPPPGCTVELYFPVEEDGT